MALDDTATLDDAVALDDAVFYCATVGLWNTASPSFECLGVADGRKDLIRLIECSKQQ